MVTAAEFLAHFSVLCSGVVVLFFIALHTTTDLADLNERVLLGLSLGAITFLVIMYPMVQQQGSSFDTRAAPVVMAAYLGGPLSGVIAASMGSLARYFVGGAGTSGGILSLFLYVIVGLAAARTFGNRGRLGLFGWAAVGLAATVLATPAFFVNQTFENGLALLQNFWLVLLIGNLASITLLGLMKEEVFAVLNEMRSHARELEHANALQERTIQEMRSLLYAVTHDLKSPVITIRGFAGVVDQAVAADRLDAVKDGVARILRASERLSDMIEALMQYSAMSAVPVTRTSVDIGKLVSTACEMLDAKIEAQQARISLVTNMPVIWSSEPHVLRILLNLIDNAVKYGCPTPGMVVEIGIRTAPEGSILTVADHGPGINEADRGDVFRLFRRLRPSSHEGAGIGLPVVEKLAKALGGWCRISQTDGGGAAFSVLLAPTPPIETKRRKDEA